MQATIRVQSSIVMSTQVSAYEAHFLLFTECFYNG